jgi:hypothetical protein
MLIETNNYSGIPKHAFNFIEPVSEPRTDSYPFRWHQLQPQPVFPW